MIELRAATFTFGLIRPTATGFMLSLCIVWLLNSCTNPTISKKSELEEQLSQPLRGVWLTNIDSDILFDSQKTKEALVSIKKAGFNTVYPVVWNDGYTLHPSDIMVQTFGEEFRQDTVFRSLELDPLQNVIDHAKPLGLVVIPWFEFGFSSSYQQDGGHILAAKPEWAARDKQGNILTKNGFEWMNAIHPEVQDFLLDLVTEVLVNYEVAGIQGDDRLPAMPSEGGYSSYTQELYKLQTGLMVPDDPKETKFLDWKADQLSLFAGRLFETVKSYNTDVIVSMAPSVYPWSKEQYLQDWPQWLADGSLDELIPQNYRWDIESYELTLEELVTSYKAAKQPNASVRFATGIIIKAGDRFNDYSYVKEAIDINRKNGVQGEVYFFYEGLFEQNGFLIDSLATHHYSLSN
ncbi:MAG: family 10 glycosylhydrolase [Bacteroidetes bacterium]|nr:family 10 glycosylhydrolase [Balneolaceae bacterium]MDA0736699.1 family 10 glycosylhydrolase [Bacteroidota bacterium]MDA1125385.1 family 10 glycosylhydrolase [Bacteroidota bacterium]